MATKNDPDVKTDPKPEEEPEAPVMLKSGSIISDDTTMRCGKCGATFWAKDAPEGICPAVDSQTGATCGGTMGPIQA